MKVWNSNLKNYYYTIYILKEIKGFCEFFIIYFYVSIKNRIDFNIMHIYNLWKSISKVNSETILVFHGWNTFLSKISFFNSPKASTRTFHHPFRYNAASCNFFWVFSLRSSQPTFFPSSSSSSSSSYFSLFFSIKYKRKKNSSLLLYFTILPVL